jgi:hypothetical protein
VNCVAMVCRVRMVAAHGLPVHARPHLRCASLRVIVGIAHWCRIVLSQGGAPCAVFVGTANSQACRRGYSQVTTEAACKSLALIGGKWYGGTVNLTSVPPGCFWFNLGDVVFLNTNPAGNRQLNAQQLCAGAPHAHTAAIARTDTHARTPVPAPCSGACRQAGGCDCRARSEGAHAQPSRRYGRCNGPHELPRALRHAKYSRTWCVEFRAAFAIGGANSDGCPQNYSPIETEAACASLADIAGASLADIGGANIYMYAGSEEFSYYPAGCFRHTVSGKFYWNTHESGANNSFAQPLCAGAPHARAAMRAAGMRRYVVVRACLITWYSGTLQSGGTRVLSTQVVNKVLSTRAVLGVLSEKALRFSVIWQKGP